jgi:hypothetical protein
MRRGAIPLAGDVLDFAWKANRKNARLLEQHLRVSAGLRGSRETSSIVAAKVLFGDAKLPLQEGHH